MVRKSVQFAAIMLMAVALVPAGAHLFALPHKLALERDAYFTVQGIYAGWALFAIVYFGALLANLALAASLRHQRGPFWLALLGVLSVVVFFAVFFAWTFPANQATANWTEMPENWEMLRRNWEYSHAANAGILFAGLVAVTLAAITAEE